MLQPHPRRRLPPHRQLRLRPRAIFRIDDDYQFGIQLWAGATHSLGGGVGLATDIYLAEGEPGVYKGPGGLPVANSWYGEFDIGPAFTFGPLSLTPMAGIGYDWGAKHVTALNLPQLYTILNTDSIYIESWIWTLLYSPFKEAACRQLFPHARLDSLQVIGHGRRWTTDRTLDESPKQNLRSQGRLRHCRLAGTLT